MVCNLLLIEGYAERLCLGPCEFLLDENICKSLNGRKIQVRFIMEYDSGHWFGRTGFVAASRFQPHPGNPPVGEHEVAVSWTDSHSSTKPIHRNVDICYLKPAHPISKNGEVLVIQPWVLKGENEPLSSVYRLSTCQPSKNRVEISHKMLNNVQIPMDYVVSVCM
jgi:hypothetical protein